MKNIDNLYDMCFKRKSVRIREVKEKLTKEELNKVKEYLNNVEHLDDSIKVEFRILKKEETTSKFGEYCLLLYSEKKDNYLLNAGYILEQIDLYLESIDIGVCYVGLARTSEKVYDGLDYVIMISFGKNVDETLRKNIDEFTRKDLSEFWSEDFNEDIKQLVRLAPSACNSQPWIVKNDEKSINVYRILKTKALIAPRHLKYFNKIDMGIFLCFLEIGLNKNKIKYQRLLASEIDGDDKEIAEVSRYIIENNN